MCSISYQVIILLASLLVSREQYKIESTRRKAAVNQAKEKVFLPSPPSTSASSKRRMLSSSKSRTSKSKDVTTEYEGIHFPPNLNTPTAVAKVLAQKPGVMTVAQLKTATTTGGASGSSYSGSSSYQLKEAVFLQKVKENDEEEKANRIRWLVLVWLDLFILFMSHVQGKAYRL